jgi:hypothetical protein
LIAASFESDIAFFLLGYESFGFLQKLPDLKKLSDNV